MTLFERPTTWFIALAVLLGAGTSFSHDSVETGRVLRGRPGTSDFDYLSPPEQGRKLVFLMDNEGLSQITKLGGYDALKKIGYSDADIANYIQAGLEFQLISLPHQEGILPATWDNLVPMLRATYPELVGIIEKQLPALKAHSGPKGYRQIAAAIPEAERSSKMTAARLKTGKGELWEVRKFLHDQLNMNPLYMGDGFTYAEVSGALARGVREYFAINRPLSELKGVHTQVLRVELKGTPQRDMTATNPDLPCPPTDTTATRVGEILDAYDPPDFTTVNGQIQEGAIYDNAGNLLCVIPWDPSVISALPPDARESTIQAMHGAWVYSAAAPFVRTATACRNWVQHALEGKPDKELSRLRLTNNQLLRRLTWIDGEGACNEVVRTCPLGEPSPCSVPSSPEMGSKYFAYAIESGKSTYFRGATGKDADYDHDATREAQESLYMKQACSTSIDGKVVSVYDSYFVKHLGNTHYAFEAIRKPSHWFTNPPTLSDTEALDRFAPKTNSKGYTPDYEVAQRRSRVARCLSDVIDSVSKPESSPFAAQAWKDGAPTAWAGGIGMSSSKSCGANSLEVNLRTFGGATSHNCIYRYRHEP